MFVFPLHICTPHMFVCPRGVHPPICPILFCPLCFGGFACCGGCNELPFVLGHLPYTTPVWGCFPFNYTPHTQSLVPCALVCFRDISMLCGHFPSVRKGLGVFPPSVREFRGTSALGMSICSFLYILCSALCLTFLTMAPTTTPPVTVVSSGLSSVSSVTVAPSLTGFAVSLDQHGMVPPPPLMPRGSGGVLGSVSVPQQQTPSSVPPLAYTNYVMGSPQVGCFFRVDPPTILYLIYVWCPFWCLLFTFRCRIGCHIHLWGLNH